MPNSKYESICSLSHVKASEDARKVDGEYDKIRTATIDAKPISELNVDVNPYSSVIHNHV